MAQVIKIKRSDSTATPGSSLAKGELGYSYNSNKLFIGDGSTFDVIGGQVYVEMLDHAVGTLQANSALITNGDSKLEQLKVDNIDINGNTISTTSGNASINIQPNGSGDVNLKTDTVCIGDTNVGANINYTEAKITTNGTRDLTLDTNAGTNSGYITIQDGADQNIIIEPHGTGKLSVDGDTHITGDLTVDGSFNFISNKLYNVTVQNETVIRTNEQIDISNSVDAPALKVTQYGSSDISGVIAKFIDGNLPNNYVEFGNQGKNVMANQNISNTSNASVLNILKEKSITDLSNIIQHSALQLNTTLVDSYNHGRPILSMSWDAVNSNSSKIGYWCFGQGASSTQNTGSNSTLGIGYTYGNSSFGWAPGLFITEDYKLGIGIQDPLKKLEVVGDISCSEDLFVHGNTYLYGTTNIYGLTTIDNSLNVTSAIGIGTTNPARNLDLTTTGQITFGNQVNINNTVNPGIFWHDDDNYGIYRTIGNWNDDTGNFQQLLLKWKTGIILDPMAGEHNKSHVGVNGGMAIGTNYYTTTSKDSNWNNGMIIQGNVGIGTNSPSEKLEVNGNIKCNSITVDSEGSLSTNNVDITGGNISGANITINSGNTFKFKETE